MAIPPLDFDLDFATPAQWAAYYRSCGWQVVPAKLPGLFGAPYKMPAVAWRQYQKALIDAPLFNAWYHPVTGEHASRQNMGLIAGDCSSGIFVLDLDTQRTASAAAWWDGLLAVHNNRLPVETVEQITGGGGRQLLFRVPPGTRVQTIKTTLGVDVRADGGFAMLPPSLHESGKHYAWAPGCAPWEVEVAMAPPWLLEAIHGLARGGGGGSTGARPKSDGAGPFEKASGGAADPDYAGFGRRTNGREQYMADLVWAAIVGLRMVNPIGLPRAAELEKVFADYERHCAPKVVVPGESNADGLEREGRGMRLFVQKWNAALAKWDNEIAGEAMARAEREKTAKDHTADFTGAAKLRAALAASPGSQAAPGKLILTMAEFIAGFMPPAYTIDGIVQRGFLYGLTAKTGDGKTTVTMYMAQAVARGVPMHGCETLQGNVLFLAGENPDDIRARFMVLAEHYGFDLDAVPIFVIAGIVDIAARMAEIKAAVAAIGDLSMVIVDTATAYFPGDEPNNNAQQGAYARLLREFTFLPGRPTVVTNCHPVKNAKQDNLLPLGGSAFVNEIDGNLTLWSPADQQVTLHWQGKFRGPELEPLSFKLAAKTSESVKDAKGRLMKSVVAEPMSEGFMEAAEQAQEKAENELLKLINGTAHASFAVLARKMSAMSGETVPRWRIQRLVNRLKGDGMLKPYRGGKWELTAKGERAIGIKKDQDDDE